MSLGLGRFKDSRHIGRSVGLGFVIQLWDTSESSTDFSFTAVSDRALEGRAYRSRRWVVYIEGAWMYIWDVRVVSQSIICFLDCF